MNGIAVRREFASSLGNTATVGMFNSAAARIMRTAISPRFAISNFKESHLLLCFIRSLNGELQVSIETHYEFRQVLIVLPLIVPSRLMAVKQHEEL